MNLEDLRPAVLLDVVPDLAMICRHQSCTLAPQDPDIIPTRVMTELQALPISSG